ncbi:MAG: hypothetical protein IJ197_04220 [Bacteroidaceae bacterium]|nr:hypothetical protein [Bacteroidaceae bacterium]
MMRNRLFFSLFMGMFALMLHAQADVTVLSDVTSKIANADFTADSPITETVCTYDYDMNNNGTTLYGQQAVTGWTAAHLSDNTLVDGRTDGLNARAGGIYAYRADEASEGPGLGSTSYLAPLVTEGFAGPGLGMVAVWGADIKYSQDVTLPAGGYMMIVTLQNTAGDAEVQWSNMGFSTADTDFRSSKVTYYVDGTFETDTILFRLKAETAGQITLGYKSGNFGSGTAPHIFVDNVKLYTIDEKYFDQVEIDEAKAQLLALIEEGKMREADTSAAQAVYDNPNATLAEVLAAIEAQKELNEGAVTDLSEFFIVNPHFSQDDPIEDGITTYDYDMEDPNGSNGKKVTHYGMQPVTGWTASDMNSNARASGVFALGSDAFLGGGAFLPPTAMSNGQTEGKLLGFVSVWSARSQYTQNVTIPAGKYTLVFSYYNGGGTGTVSANLMGFVSEDGTEYLGKTTTFTPVNEWKTEAIEFELGEETTGYFSMGYTAANAGSGSMPHLFIDGVSLYYVGTDIDPSLLALNSAINQGNRALDEVFNADLKAQLEEAVQAAEDLFASHAGDADENKAAASAVTSLMDAVNASIDAYKKLQDFHDNVLLPATEKYDEERFPELGGNLQTLLGEVEDAIQDGLWNNEQIDEAIASYPVIVKEGVQKVWDAAVASGETLDEDLDISVLFDQLAYTYSTSAVSNTSVPDKEWQYGSATNFKTQYGTAEVWNQSPFTVSRTISDLPAGKYTITTKAFFRKADNATNYTEWDPANTPEANLFAGSVKEGLTNVASIASPDLATLDGATTVDEGVYVPNSQHGAYLLFNDEAYTDALQKSVSTVLATQGDLTFGITADEMADNCWVVWYTFSIAYNAPDRNALFDVLDALDLETRNLQDKEEVAFNQAADGKINEAQGKNEVRDDMSDDELKALITEFEAAIAYAEESVTLATQLKETYELYNLYLMTDVDSDEPTYNELLGDIEAVLNDGYESNEQIQGFIDGLADGWTAYVQYPVLETSSEEEPGNISAVIYNPGFVDPVSGANNANGWTIEYDGGNNGGEFETYEFFGNNSFRISQTIKGLAEGYYRIRVQAFYRAGSNVVNADTLTLNPDSINHAYLFGQTESTSYAKALKNVLERENEEGELETGIVGAGAEVEVTNYKDYESFYVPNNREAFAAYNSANIYWNQLDVHVVKGEALTLGLYKETSVASDWCPFDNFQLYFLGTEAPTAVEGVEADATVLKTNDAIYNIAGQRVSKATKGLYIIGGKKVLVK